MTLFLHVCGVLAVLSIPYAVIMFAGRRSQQKKRNSWWLQAGVQTTITDDIRTRAF